MVLADQAGHVRSWCCWPLCDDRSMANEERRWLAELGFFDADAVPLTPDWEDWLYRVFLQHGPVEWGDLDVMAVLAIFEVADVACERVVRDFEKSVGPSISVSVVDDGGVAFDEEE